MSNIYLLSIPESSGSVNCVRRMLVSAATEAAAREVASVMDDGDADWTDTDITSEVIADPALYGYGGWKFEIRVSVPPAFGIPQPDLVASYTGVAYVFGGPAADTLQQIGVGLETALNALPEIDNAAYDHEARSLVVATGGGDVLGDRSMSIFATPPGAKSGAIALAGGGIVDSLVFGGKAADDLSIQFSSGPDYENWNFLVRVSTAYGVPATDAVLYTGGAGDSLEDVCDGLVTLFLAIGPGTYVSDYDPILRILRVDDGSSTLGDQILEVDIYAPAGVVDQSPRLVSGIVCDGAGGDPLAIGFIDEGVVPPLVLKKLA